MKEFIASLLTLSLLLCSFAGIAAAQTAPDYAETALTIGAVRVYDFGDVKLHAYATNDALGDENFALETATGIVLLESNAFEANVAEWSEYISKLGKPVEGALLSYHPNGAEHYGDVTVYATENALKNWGEGGSIRSLVDSFIAIFGDALNTNMPTKVEMMAEGSTVTIGGIDFDIVAAGDDAYSVVIPAINSVYRHMMGSACHNILANVGHIDATIAELKAYQTADYALVLTSHWVPEGQDAVTAKIAYLEKTKELADSCDSAESFIAAMTEAFPDYAGANYLEMTAGFLFP